MNWSFSVSSCNKGLLQKGIICLNLVRIWYIVKFNSVVISNEFCNVFMFL